MDYEKIILENHIIYNYDTVVYIVDKYGDIVELEKKQISKIINLLTEIIDKKDAK